ncbi:hypothetical protein MSTE_03545 [Mycobacteroides stephanolepidis]|uniref:Uncharacterized protein n=1 Tax=[Mycobacterium] stephanolepidis TaxID=1520670 RepID=A0A1Z4F0T6_9MYCO|nr:hypothetical protein [[Mycobacterium] stephanolepidis]BAX98845.1 hypothetical protein MSTE_03545 [[Mycobacterium] stephanolepidis]
MITAVKVGALCGAVAAATGALTFVVATHIAPGERQRDPRLGEPRGRFGW